MSGDEESVTEFYGKEENGRVDIELVDVTHTGSYDDRENQIAIVTAPSELAKQIRRGYRRRDMKGVKDFEFVRNDDGTASLYFGGSYGAGELLGSIGTAIYYGDVFHDT